MDLTLVQDRRLSPIEIRFATDRQSEEGTYTIMWWMRVSQANISCLLYCLPLYCLPFGALSINVGSQNKGHTRQV